MLTRLFLCFTAGLTISAICLAQTTYYVDPGGSDSNDGRSSTSAWKSVAKVNAIAFQPGDQVLFRRGQIWREQLCPRSSGNAAARITYGAFGFGAKPIISDVRPVPGSGNSGSWTRDGSSDRWYISLSKDPWRVLLGGVEFGTAPPAGAGGSEEAAITARWRWFWKSSSARLYVYSPDGVNPAARYGIVESAVGDNGHALKLDGASYLAFSSLDFRGGNSTADINASDYLTFDSCAIGAFSGGYGMWITRSNHGVVRYCQVNRLDSIMYTFNSDYGEHVQGAGDCISLRDGSSYWEIHHSVIRGFGHDGVAIGTEYTDGAECTGTTIHHNEFRCDGDYGRAFNFHRRGLTSYTKFYQNYIHNVTQCSHIQGLGNEIYYNLIDTMVLCRWRTDGNQTVALVLDDFDPSGANDGNKVYNNTIRNCVGSGIDVQVGSKNPVVENNIIYNTGSTEFLNGSWSADSIRNVGLALWGGVSNARIRNNIIYNRGANCTIYGEDVYKGGGASRYSVTEFNSMANNGNVISGNIGVDPQIQSDMRLQSSSPAIDAGVECGASTDFWGGAVPYNGHPDIGAHEWRPTGGSQLVPPKLLSPPDGSGGLASTVRMQWARSAGANSYELQLSTTADFKSIVVNRVSISDTVQDVGSLPAGTKLYWRVRSNNGTTVSDYSSGWSFSTLPGSTLISPKLLLPPDGAAGLPSSVRMQWARSAGANSYDIQLSATSDFKSTIVNRVSISDTVQDATSLASGTRFYWRVRSNNGSTVSDYSPVWSFATRPDTVATERGDIANVGTPVALVGSPKGSGNKSLEIVRDGVMPPAGSADPTYQYDTWDGSLKSFEWLGYTFAQVHRMNRVKFQEGIRLVSSGGWFSNLKIQVRQNGSWVDVAGLASTPPYPTTAGGSYGTYDLTFSPIIGDGIRLAGTPAGASTYISVAELRVYEVPMIAPTAPAIVEPASGAANTPTLVAVRWSRVDDAQSYRFQLSLDSLFRSFVRNDSLFLDTVRVIGGLSGGTRHFTRVQACNSAGSSPFSTVSRFTTAAGDVDKTTMPPSTPTIVAPLGGSTVEPATLTLRWTKSSDAILYHLQVASDSLFQSLFIDDSALTDTTRPIGPLLSMRSYYAHVHAQNVGGISPFSPMVKFQTAGETSTVPAAPTLAAPPDNALLPLANARLVWNGASGAQGYQVQVGQDYQFLTLLLDTTVSGTSFEFKTLEPARQYYWRVRAVESTKLSDYSPVRAFAVNPVSTFLNQNYPNPFNPSTQISYNLEREELVELTIYDILGRMVLRLVNDVQQAGVHRVVFDGGSGGYGGVVLASGVYFCRLRTSGYQETRKMLLRK